MPVYARTRISSGGVVRKRLVYKAQWEGSIEGWTVKFCRCHEWRTLPAYAWDDLCQEAYLKFMRCDELYSPVVKSDRHFMALYKVAVRNLINALSTRRTLSNQITLSEYATIEDTDTEELFVDHTGGLDDSFLRLLIADAPEEVAELLRRLLPDPAFARKRSGRRETVEERADRMDRPFFQRKHGVRETTNEYLCRLANLDPSAYDLVRLIHSWIQGDPCHDVCRYEKY